MSGSARVLSIEALEAIKVSFVRFRMDAGKALDAVEQDLRRILDRLEDQQKYWQRMIRTCQDEVNRAKSELARRKMGYERGTGPGCTEQEEALDLAKRRLQHAELKSDKSRQWNRSLPQAVLEYEGPARQLGGFLDVEVQQAIAYLEQKIRSLEAYLATQAPAAPQLAPAPEATPPASTAT